MRGVAITTSLLFVLTASARACGVCPPMPGKTAADLLIESQTIAFVREHPRRPFTYKTVEILRGEAPSDAKPFGDQFPSALTRRRLKNDETSVVALCRADETSPWRSLGFADTDYQQTLRRILAESSSWKGEEGAERRLAFFLPFFGHKKRYLAEQAYIEWSRASYTAIQGLARSAARRDWMMYLRHPHYLKWRPLAIVMLAQTADAQERTYLEDQFDMCEDLSLTLNLAALATAYIELNGERGVERVERDYLRNADRGAEEIRQVLTALRIHRREGDPRLRERLERAFAVAAVHHPEAVEQFSEPTGSEKIERTAELGKSG